MINKFSFTVDRGTNKKWDEIGPGVCKLDFRVVADAREFRFTQMITMEDLKDTKSLLDYIFDAAKKEFEKANNDNPQ